MSEKEIHIVFQVLNFLSSLSGNPQFTTLLKTMLPIDRLLLIHIARHNGRKGMCPSLDLLSGELGVTKSYLIRRLYVLEEKKLIEIYRKRGRRHVYFFPFLAKSYPQSGDLHVTTQEVTSGDLQVTRVVTYRSPEWCTTGHPIRETNKYQERESALSAFLPDDQNLLLCTGLGLKVEEELESFRNRHKGKVNQYEFRRWMENSNTYRKRKVANKLVNESDCREKEPDWAEWDRAQATFLLLNPELARERAEKRRQWEREHGKVSGDYTRGDLGREG